jgi:AbrB family looped-hinge helix DNA binding protein
MFYFLLDAVRLEADMRVTSKGQVTIPKHIRRRTGIHPGSEVEFAEKEGKIVVMKSAERRGRKRAHDEFDAYLDRVTGIVDLGMTTDEFMQLLRGE